MANSYYNHSTYPTPNSPGSSAQMRAELQLVASGFDKLPVLSGAGVANRPVVMNGTGTAMVTTTALGGLDITGSTINGTPIGSITPAPGAFTTLAVAAAAALGSNVTINGGAINGTAIGGVTPAAGAFTTLSAISGITGNLTGNVTGNLTGNVTGNVTGNLSGNVTSTGTSTFNNVTINGTLNMDAGSVATIENLSAPVNPGDAANKGYVDAQDALKLNLAGGSMTGAVAMGSNRITGLADPVNPQDAATKVYVDNAVQGLDAKDSCRVATTASITLSGTQTIDGVAVVAGERVLVKDQATPSQNGIYLVASGAWSRAPDANTWNELINAFTFVERGTANGQNGYVCTITAGGTLETTAVTFVQFSGAGQVVAGSGMTKIGNTLSVGTASSARIVVNSDDLDLATTGITAGTYRSVTVDQWGRATAGTNPTTVAGYGITDTYTKAEEDALLAQKLSLSGGSMTGPIAMGANKITGLADPAAAQDAVTLNYVTTLFGSTASAAASASAANTSAINAAASETNANIYAGQALTSANNAAASYDAFDDRYLGSKTTDPTTDNDGNALLEGALYWNSSAKVLKVFDGAGWLAAYLPATGYLPVSGGTMTGNIAFAGTQTWPTFNQSTTGNAATATKLQTARTINGVAFDGTANIALSKADIGLGNVDNTSDANKPISTATQTELNGKLSISGGTLSGALNEAPALTLASAATTDIGAQNANTLTITGTTTITSLGTIAAGATRRLVFTGALTLTHNATSLILPGGANITTAAGDVAEFLSLGAGNWRCTLYQKASGGSVVTASGVPEGVFLVENLYTATTSFVVPAGVSKVRGYAVGAGGNATTTASGGGGGMAFGTIATTPGETLTVDITSGIAKVLRGSTVLLQGNPASGATAGTASKDVSVTAGGAFSGGAGATGGMRGGGASAASPLGNGFSGQNGDTTYGSGGSGIGGVGGPGGAAGGGGGAGGAGGQSGGGSGGAALQAAPGEGRTIKFTDPLLAPLTGSGGVVGFNSVGGGGGGPGAGGGGSAGTRGGPGGFGGGGGAGTSATGGVGGALGGGGGSNSGFGGSGGFGGGGGSGDSGGGTGGAAAVWIFY